MRAVRPRRGRTQLGGGGGSRLDLGRRWSFVFGTSAACSRLFFCEVARARAACDATTAGTLPHGFWGARAGPGPTIRAGAMAATGAAVANESLGLLGRSRVGHNSIQHLLFGDCWAPLTSEKDGGSATLCAGSAGKGAWGVWSVDEHLRAATGGRQAASKAPTQRVTALFLAFLAVPNVLFFVKQKMVT